MTSGPVRPSAEDWLLETERLHDRVDIVRPQLRVAIRVARFVGEPVTAEVHGHQPVVIRQVRTELTAPAQGALGETVDKQDRLPVRISRFQDVQTRSSAAGDVFTFIVSPRRGSVP